MDEGAPTTAAAAPEPELAAGKPARWPVIVALLVLSWALIAGVRYSAPADLLDNDQWLTSAYTVDIFANGNWIAQRDPLGRPATKPPLQPWLGAALSAPGGRVTWFTEGLAAALAVLATALLAMGAAGRWFGASAGLIAGAATLASPLMVKHVWLVRPDSVFLLAVFVGALLTWRAWDKGRGWVWVWIVAAVVTLAKTPFGIPIMLGGLLAALTVRAPKPEAPADEKGRGVEPVKRSNFMEHLIGLSLFTLAVVGWFLAARWQLGSAFTQTTLGDEIAGHTVGVDSDQYFGKGYLRAPWYFLARLAPWSVVACIAMWRLWARPSPDLRMRRLERFLFFAVVVGLAVVGLAAKPRAEHVLPFAPFVAVLAARELASWALLRTGRRAYALAAGAALVAAGAAVGQYHIERRDHPHVMTGRGMAALAEEIRPLVQGGAAFADVDAPYALQFGVGTMQVRSSAEDAAALLRGSGPALVFVTAASAGAVGGPGAPGVVEMARWPATGEAEVVVLGNEAAVRLRTLKGR